MKEHPIPFHKASFLGKAPKKLSGAGPAPDLEDAFDVCPLLKIAEGREANNYCAHALA